MAKIDLLKKMMVRKFYKIIIHGIMEQFNTPSLLITESPKRGKTDAVK